MKKNLELSDFNVISIETVSKLFSALTAAMRELRGGNDIGDTVMSRELYCTLWPLQTLSCMRIMECDRKKAKYRNMDGRELLRELYLRMKNLHHFKGLSWHVEENGRFGLMLGDCALNLEHSMGDIRRDDCPEGTLFCIGYDPYIDCEDRGSALFGRYENALNFCCSFKDGDAEETRDVTFFDRYPHREMLRDVLAGIDMIGDMATEKSNENK